MMVQQNLILILLLWCSGAEAPFKILLRWNSAIRYTSDHFYEQRLLASGRQTAHAEWYPLTLFNTKGEDVQDENSTSFYNDTEVSNGRECL